MVLLDLSGLNPNLTALNQTSFGLSLSSAEEEEVTDPQHTMGSGLLSGQRPTQASQLH